jgi:hypothetical protein
VTAKLEEPFVIAGVIGAQNPSPGVAEVSSSEIALKCRECADKALALARQAQTVRETRNLLQLAETWMRLAARFDRCVRQPPRSAEEKLFAIFLADLPQSEPAVDAQDASPPKAA